MLIFEKSSNGRYTEYLPMESDIPAYEIGGEYKRGSELPLPELSENDVTRHYSELERKSHGVNDGFYPLGSCTMKYNPKSGERAASLSGFRNVHPLSGDENTQGCLAALKTCEDYLKEITGMDAVTFQPAAGAHGEFTGLLLIKAYHHSKGDTGRNKIIVPDSAHGTNPASAAMCGWDIVNIESDEKGLVNLDKLREVCDESVAGLMLTNPNTLGIFDPNIKEITKIVHDCGGLCYYDGANLNAIMGIVRPGDMGFDCIHLNLHKTFATPHGGGGPGSGAVGCKDFLTGFLPGITVSDNGNGHYESKRAENSIGNVTAFYGNFLVVIKALSYVMQLGREGVPESSSNAVLNARYMMSVLKDTYTIAKDEPCMHEFVMSLTDLKKETGVSALDIAKGLLDHGIHPPTMYFPLIVDEALMIEPTETESKEVMDHACKVFKDLYELAHKDPEALHNAPGTTPVSRLDEVNAARNPKLIWIGD